MAEPEEPKAAAAPEAHEDEGPEPPMEPDNPRVSLITAAYVVTLFVVVCAVIFSREAFNYVLQTEHQRKVAEPVSKQLTDLRKMEAERLVGYQWVDEGKGVVRMPKERAEALVLTKYSQIPIEPEPEPEPAPSAAPPPPPEPGGSEPDGAGGNAGGALDAPEGDGKKAPEEKKEEKAPEKKEEAPKPKKKPQPPPPPEGGADPY